MNGKDYYEMLGVTKKASSTEIKKAYRKLARRRRSGGPQFHGDVGQLLTLEALKACGDLVGSADADAGNKKPAVVVGHCFEVCARGNMDRHHGYSGQTLALVIDNDSGDVSRSHTLGDNKPGKDQQEKAKQ